MVFATRKAISFICLTPSLPYSWQPFYGLSRQAHILTYHSLHGLLIGFALTFEARPSAERRRERPYVPPMYHGSRTALLLHRETTKRPQ